MALALYTLMNFPKLFFLCSITCQLVLAGDGVEKEDVLFVVWSQRNSHHVKRTDAFIEHLTSQGDVKVHKLHERWPSAGAWTILPIIPSLVEDEETLPSWLFICEEETRIDLNGLLQLLSKYDAKEELFIGAALRDQHSTIIHHFAFYKDPSSFAYPDFAAGMAFSKPLLVSLAERMNDQRMKSDFSIDGKHELAMYVWNDGKGVRLTEDKALCAGEAHAACVTTYPHKMPDCGDPVPTNDVFIAVKTCEKFHEDRIPVVKKTWAPQTRQIEYYSEVEDSSIPTIDLGVPNTESGHCGKTYAIMERFLEKKTHPWLIIVDDDTLLSVPRLTKLLACYDPEESVALGERYGYAVNTPYGGGYNYITGGGGMVFSRTVVKRIIEHSHCKCHKIDSPDDMILGMCLNLLSVPVTHSPLFHQARPDDYSADFLKHQIPVSFHKHWNNDPYQVYKDWLSGSSKHEEL